MSDRCPTCGSDERNVRAVMPQDDDRVTTRYYCSDAWHDQHTPLPDALDELTTHADTDRESYAYSEQARELTPPTDKEVEAAFAVLDGGFDDAVSNSIPTDRENVYEHMDDESDYSFIERRYVHLHDKVLATLHSALQAERERAASAQ